MFSVSPRAASLASIVAFTVLAHSPAFAADIKKPQAALPPEQRFERVAPPGEGALSGWYIGGLLGYGFADTDINAPAGSFDFDADGAVAGGLIGWNFVNGPVLVGLEADFLGGDVEASQSFGANRVNASVDWMAGLRARAGVHVTPQMFLFGMIGVGFAEIDLPTTGAGGGPASETFSGLQYGAGAEAKLSENWNLRLDYLYTDLDSGSITYAGGTTATYDPDIHQARAGLVYKF